MSMRGLVLTLSSATLLVVLASTNLTLASDKVRESAADSLPEIDLSDADAKAGKKIYMKNCVACHKADGSGGQKTTASGSPSPNFRDPKYWDGKSNGILVRATENGIPKSGMVAWKGVLKREEILDVTAYIRDRYQPKKSKKEDPEPEASPADSASTDEPVSEP